MYNLFHIGVVFPIAVLEIQKPRCRTPSVEPAAPEVEKRRGARGRGYAAVGRLTNPHDWRPLVPDYLENPPHDMGQYFVLCVRHKEALSTQLYNRRWLRWKPDAESRVVKVDTDIALVRWEDIEREVGWTVTDEAGVRDRLEILANGFDPSDPYFETIRRICGRLDGRAKQLLWQARNLAARSGEELKKNRREPKLAYSKKRNDEIDWNIGFQAWTLGAYPLCALAEYEVQKLLNAHARRMAGEGRQPVVDDMHLPLSYEAMDSRLTGARAISTLCEDLPNRYSSKFQERLHEIRRARNRVMHSFHLEASHGESLRANLFEVLLEIYKDLSRPATLRT
ncbi:MAG TPA: hypothetical protein VNB06_14860 [Thermoanaerobaculia bacterium]|nr:hypothetical protein [Thermoanaerobaculia bacterium]